MPYNTYRNSKEALINAKKIMKKTKCDAVKLEGGKKIFKIVKLLVKNNIPVMGHLGVLPQSAKNFKFKGTSPLTFKNAFAALLKANKPPLLSVAPLP